MIQNKNSAYSIICDWKEVTKKLKNYRVYVILNKIKLKGKYFWEKNQVINLFWLRLNREGKNLRKRCLNLFNNSVSNIRKKIVTGIFCYHFLIVNIGLIFRNLQVIDNQRVLTQLSYKLEPRRTWRNASNKLFQITFDVPLPKWRETTVIGNYTLSSTIPYNSLQEHINFQSAISLPFT